MSADARAERHAVIVYLRIEADRLLHAAGHEFPFDEAGHYDVNRGSRCHWILREARALRHVADEIEAGKHQLESGVES